jgi:hypothetical protein
MDGRVKPGHDERRNRSRTSQPVTVTDHAGRVMNGIAGSIVVSFRRAASRAKSGDVNITKWPQFQTLRN